MVRHSFLLTGQSNMAGRVIPAEAGSIGHEPPVRAAKRTLAGAARACRPRLSAVLSPALREFVLRYYDQFTKPESKNNLFADRTPPQFAVRTGLEHL